MAMNGSPERNPEEIGPRNYSGTIILFAAVISIPFFLIVFDASQRGRRTPGPLTLCKSNLKNIGTALEMYSTDFSGHYPQSLSCLTPEYLETLPACQIKHRRPYKYLTSAAYNTGKFSDYYFLHCTNNDHHALHRNQPMGYPQYDVFIGLLER